MNVHDHDRRIELRSIASWLMAMGLLACGVLAALAGSGAPVILSGDEGDLTAPPLDLFDAACAGDNPYLITTCFARSFARGEPALVAFHDTEDDSDHFALADSWQLGAAYGLAYRPDVPLIYVAAYLKRGAPFGPAGPGGIYIYDLRSGELSEWLRVPNVGLDPHDRADDYFPDAGARDLVGKRSLGDIDLSPDGQVLFVMNLADRQIYRYRTADGMLLGSFPHGAASESWSDDARPFGLKTRGDRLYHGVINSAEVSKHPRWLDAQVYESAFDGSEVRLVLDFNLRYERGTSILRVPANWRPWRDFFHPTTFYGSLSVYPQPMLSDIEFTAEGDMILGFRDRFGDMTFGFFESGEIPPGEGIGISAGDIVIARRRGDEWIAEPEPEHYVDDGPLSQRNLAARHAETSFGGLAQLTSRDVVVMTGMSPLRSDSGGAFWLDNATGIDLGREQLYYFIRTEPASTFNKSNGLGDLELLCRAPTPTATATLTETPIPTPTSTWTSSATPTQTRTVTPTNSPTPTASRTPSATADPSRIYLPVAIRDGCPLSRPPLDVVLVIDLSSSMLRETVTGRRKVEAAIEAAQTFVRQIHGEEAVIGGRDRVAVVGFNSDAWIALPFSEDADAIDAALDDLSDRVAEFTRIDLALSRAAEAVAGPGRRSDLAVVAIVLTDGLPNRVPPAEDGRVETTVLQAADALKVAGGERATTLYSVGLGAAGDLNPDLLRKVASDPALYLETPDAETLVALYARIALELRCPRAERAWP